jgi:hypothetical protein
LECGASPPEFVSSPLYILCRQRPVLVLLALHCSFVRAWRPFLRPGLRSTETCRAQGPSRLAVALALPLNSNAQWRVFAEAVEGVAWSICQSPSCPNLCVQGLPAQAAMLSKYACAEDSTQHLRVKKFH